MTQTAAETTPVRTTHRAHANMLARLDPNVAGFRWCAGVALIIDGTVTPPNGEGDNGLGFVPNENLTWVTLVDVPIPWMQGMVRPSHMVAVRKAALRSGAPVLDQTGVEREFDYWSGPRPELELSPEIVLAADGINDAMTGTAFSYIGAWQRHADLYQEYAGDAGIKLGDRLYDPGVVKEYGWVPIPWVSVDPLKAETMYARLKDLEYTAAFKSVMVDLFVAGMPVVSPVAGYFTGTSPLMAGGTRYTQFNFREENGAKHAVVATAGATVSSFRGLKVFRGTQVGTDAPTFDRRAFYRMHPARRWTTLVNTYRPEVLDLVLGNAFSAMFRQVGDTWLMPFEILGRDVSYSLGTGKLWWDVAMVQRDDRDFSLGADPRVHVMPTMRMGAWDNFKDRLGAVAIDLTPTHKLFRAYALGRQIRRPHPRFSSGFTGHAGEVIPVAVVPGHPVGKLPELPDDMLDEAVNGNR